MFNVTELMIKVVPDDGGRAFEETDLRPQGCVSAASCEVPSGCHCTSGGSGCGKTHDGVQEEEEGEKNRRLEDLETLKAALHDQLTRAEASGVLVG